MVVPFVSTRLPSVALEAVEAEAALMDAEEVTNLLVEEEVDMVEEDIVSKRLKWIV